MKLKIKIRAKIYLILTIFILSANALLAEEETIPRFFLDYAIVDRTLKNGKGYTAELSELYKRNRSSAIFIFMFWQEKAFRECEEVTRTSAQHYRQAIINMTEEEKDRIMKSAQAEVSQCSYSFYYDSWDEINKTIVNQLKAAKINYRKNNYIWYLFLFMPLILIIVIWRKRKVLMPH